MKGGAVEVIELIKADCRLWNGTIFFTFLSFFLNFFTWYFIYFLLRILMWLYFIPKLSNFHFIFQILYSLSSQSIWKIGQSFLPPQTQVWIRLTIFVHQWNLSKIISFLRCLGNFLALGKLTLFDLAVNLWSYLRRLDYTFSKELFGSIAT